MGKIIKDVDRMSNQYAVANCNGACRPDACLLANKTPFANLDVSAMSEYSEFTLDDALATNPDPLVVARNVPDTRRSAQSSARSKLAGRAA